jgi:RNA polymerase sigma factor (sigma-70 family)
VTHNLGSNFRRKATRVELVDPKSIDGLRCQLGANGATQLSELWQEAARWLTADQVQLLRLRYEQDLSYPQIAELTQLTQPQVRARLHAARLRWRKKGRELKDSANFLPFSGAI